MTQRRMSGGRCLSWRRGGWSVVRWSWTAASTWQGATHIPKAHICRASRSMTPSRTPGRSWAPFPVLLAPTAASVSAVCKLPFSSTCQRGQVFPAPEDRAPAWSRPADLLLKSWSDLNLPPSPSCHDAQSFQLSSQFHRFLILLRCIKPYTFFVASLNTLQCP